jgi:tetratricopeptide (TPR) repeat protein
MNKPPIIFASGVVALLVSLWIFWGSPKPDAIPITTQSALALNYFIEGRDLSDQMRTEAAENWFQMAVDEDPRFALAYLYLSRVQTNSRDAVASLSRAVSLAAEVSDGERLLIQADQAGRFRQRARRSEILSELVEAYPDDFRSHYEYGRHHFRLRAWDSAIVAYRRVLDLSPTFPGAHNGLGYCYRFLGNFLPAEEYFLKYMEIIPDTPNPYDSYADLLTEMNRHSEAIQFYEAALIVQPDFEPSHLGIANNLCVLGRHDEARGQLKRLMEVAQRDSQRRAALQGLAMTYLDQSDFESAFEQLEVAHQIAIAADDSAAMARDLDVLGLMWLEIDQPEEASEAFSVALRLMTASASAPSVVEEAQLDYSLRLALVWLGRGDLAQAGELILQFQSEAVRIKDRNRIETAHQVLGMIALESGDAQQAVRQLGKSDLEQAYNQYHLALAYEAVGDLPQALRLYIKASTYDQFGRLGQAFVRQKALDRVESLHLAQQSRMTNLEL